MLTFEKQKRGVRDGSNAEFRVYVYKQPRSKSNTVSIIFRIARPVLDRAGWFVGDHAIPCLDEASRRWVLSRTTDRTKGYMITSTEKGERKTAYLKATVTKEAAEKAVPGGSCDCHVIEADARTIVGQF